MRMGLALCPLLASGCSILASLWAINSKLAIGDELVLIYTKYIVLHCFAEFHAITRMRDLNW